MLVENDRTTALGTWYREWSGRSDSDLTLIAGDASFRRYFRAPLGEGTTILCDSPPQTEKNDEFLALASILSGSDIRVPSILNHDLVQGFFALEDLGNEILQNHLTQKSANHYYSLANSKLLKLALIDTSLYNLDDYGRAKLEAELQLFPDWFCEGLLGVSLSDADRALLEELAAYLCTNALSQPQVLVHRDFHCRNLMLLGDGELATIDFQDAVVGPITYDPVSLYRDCYIRWEDRQVKDWVLGYRQALVGSGVAVSEEQEFLRDFDLMGLQRHLKVLGIFARLFIRDGKKAYLSDLSRVIGYVRDAANARSDIAALNNFLAWFNGDLMPRIETQTWWSAELAEAPSQ
ncbi:MAG: phosphotransferase [Pseudomonadota bacterium]